MRIVDIAIDFVFILIKGFICCIPVMLFVLTIGGCMTVMMWDTESKRDEITARLKKELSSPVTVVELYAYRTGGKFPTNNLEVVVEDSKERRKRLYVNDNQAPIHGDVWTVRIQRQGCRDGMPTFVLDKLVKRGTYDQ